MNRFITKLTLAALIMLWGDLGIAHGDLITTFFNANNGQAGNMFDLNVLAPSGIEISQLELNLDAGSWDIELYTRSGTHVGSENTPGDWTLRQSSTGVTSIAPNLATPWDITDFKLDSGLSAFYINVTNGSALNYTNGTGVGNLVASNASVEIFEGTGNAANFGATFSPRVWNGSIEFEPIAAPTSSVPEPGAIIVIAGMCVAVTNVRRKRM